MSDTEQKDRLSEDVPRAIRLTIDQIQCYAGNPRRQINPEYERIKASIREEGLDQPLIVTQKPGEQQYILQAGGNTRLQVLQALYRETGDQQFYTVDCLLKPWMEESTVLLAHLRENELRGELPFIDKALAVFEAKRLFECEQNIDSLSVRQLSGLLKEKGFPLSAAIISKMGYAIHRLLPLIPQALEAGLGRPQIEKIRALERAGTQLWIEKGAGNEAEFTDIFAVLCRRYDSPDWDLDSLRNALENEIAEATEEPLQIIRLALGALLSGKEIPVYVPEEDEQDDTGNDTSEDEVIAVVSKVGNSAPEDAGQSVPENPCTTDPPESPLDQPSPTPLDRLRQLRQSAYESASGLAQRNGLGDSIIPLPDQGLGFLVIDVPDPQLKDTLDSDLLGQVSMLWWQLAACAEITVASLDHLLPHLNPQSVLYRALANQDAALLFDGVWTLDPGQTGYQLWRQLADQDWRTLMALMNTYRELHEEALMSGRSLWE